MRFAVPTGTEGNGPVWPPGDPSSFSGKGERAMEQTTKGSAAARRAIYYLTAGSLLLVWGGVWWVYMGRHPPAHDVSWYLCYGCLLSGLSLAVIGLITGHIGRAARQADMPPTVSAAPAPGQVQPVPGQVAAPAAPASAANRPTVY
jgi:hypothetical protein